MASSSSSSAAAAEPRLPKHDVFLSFRGEDTRNNFTAHLYSALSRKQIGAYIDQVSLKQGSEISPELLNAIEESEISIIIFSKNYASSSWCLDELVHILKCKKEKARIVLPIFLGIDPSHIRKQKRSYAEAFVGHEERFEMEKVQKWSQALKDAAAISGWDSRNMFESEIVEEVVERVRTELDTIKSKRSHDFKGSVGIPERLGSKIIVTSRYKLKVDQEYKVEALDFNDACKLFYLNVFGEKSCRTGYEEISDRIVEYTKGHPLALQVLCASVFYFLESIEDWEKELEKLKRIPNDEIQKVLERSYDALDDEQKGLFLDIACFFKGEQRDIVVGILEDKPIAGLVHKSLITIDQDGLIPMHDLIIKMGWDIVRQLTKKLGERSRLWIPRDVSDVLNNNKGTEAIEGIYLPWTEEELHLRPDVFDDMSSLRLLKIHPFYCKVYINGEDYPGKSLPLNFNTQNLVELHMPRSNLRQLWDGIQKCGSLKLINLQFSEHLTKIPDLSLAPKLESMNLSQCRSLNHIPSLNIQVTSDESAYRPFGTERTPGYVSFRGCRRLKTLPKVSGNITVLILFGSGLKELPSSIEFIENLVRLDLRYCKRLKSLPTLPRNIEKLHLEYSGIEQIPSSSIECLCSLRELSLNNCESLESLPSIIWKLKTLEELDLSGCQKLRKLPEISNQSEHLCCLYLSDTSIQELPSSIENLIGLRRLSLRRCKRLEFIPETLCELTRLQKLSLPGCSMLSSLPSNIWKLKALEEIDLSQCTKLRNLPEISNHLEHLGKLNLARTSIQELPSSIENLIGLCDLSLERCEHLQLIPSSIGNIYGLKLLNISYCENLQSLPELPLFIEYLNARQCSSLEMVSTSRSTHTLEHWLDKYDISFVNCSKLGENAISTIFKEFQYKVFCSATTPREVVTSKGIKPQVVGCYPKHEIPKWFNNQYEGSSTTIELPPNWYSPKTFLGFVVSVVVADKDIDENADSIVECELHLMTKKDRFRVDVFEYTVTSCLDHTLMWYNYFDHSKANFEKYQDATLEFKSHFKVKWCGVRMLYLKDANFESWRTDSDTSDDDYQSWGS